MWIGSAQVTQVRATPAGTSVHVQPAVGSAVRLEFEVQPDREGARTTIAGGRPMSVSIRYSDGFAADCTLLINDGNGPRRLRLTLEEALAVLMGDIHGVFVRSAKPSRLSRPPGHAHR